MALQSNFEKTRAKPRLVEPEDVFLFVPPRLAEMPRPAAATRNRDERPVPREE